MKKLFKKIKLKFEEIKLIELLDKAPDSKTFKQISQKLLINRSKQNQTYWTCFDIFLKSKYKIRKINIFSTGEQNLVKLKYNYELG